MLVVALWRLLVITLIRSLLWMLLTRRVIACAVRGLLPLWRAMLPLLRGLLPLWRTMLPLLWGLVRLLRGLRRVPPGWL